MLSVRVDRRDAGEISKATHSVLAVPGIMPKPLRMPEVIGAMRRRISGCPRPPRRGPSDAANTRRQVSFAPRRAWGDHFSFAPVPRVRTACRPRLTLSEGSVQPLDGAVVAPSPRVGE